ncbi:MAG: hypothetical protein H7A51_13715 [Akkermansiaceae bacterium]|nr:hypothetical protein [Akkermansiaceae bacterium]
MKEHFSLKDSIYLVIGELTLDLHNNYNFSEIEYSVQNRSVRLKWSRGDGDWVDITHPKGVELIYSEVHRYEFHRRDPEMPFTEDDCLADAGFWSDDDWADGVFTISGEPEPNWLRAFEFQSGAIILIHAKEAKAIIQS